MTDTQIKCICSNCLVPFVLQYDEYELVEKGAAALRVMSCLSGGTYGVEITCPHCGHVHKLL